VDDLVDRADYCQEHGIFDATEAGKSVSYGELAAEIRSLREQVAAYEKGLLDLLANGVDKSDYPESLWSLMLALCERQ